MPPSLVADVSTYGRGPENNRVFAPGPEAEVDTAAEDSRGDSVGCVTETQGSTTKGTCTEVEELGIDDLVRSVQAANILVNDIRHATE
jgi:hypothetical protein